MLELDDPMWGKLNHAYGHASDIPEILEALATYPDAADWESEPYFSLWSALCHQGDVYTASYAAVPHIINLATKAPEKSNWNYLFLPGCIELARLQGRGPDVPIDLANDYSNAVSSLPRTVAALHEFHDDAEFVTTSAMAIAVACGHAKLAQCYLELEPSVAPEFLDWVSRR